MSASNTGDSRPGALHPREAPNHPRRARQQGHLAPQAGPRRVVRFAACRGAGASRSPAKAAKASSSTRPSGPGSHLYHPPLRGAPPRSRTQGCSHGARDERPRPGDPQECCRARSRSIARCGEQHLLSSLPDYPPPPGFALHRARARAAVRRHARGSDSPLAHGQYATARTMPRGGAAYRCGRGKNLPPRAVLFPARSKDRGCSPFTP